MGLSYSKVIGIKSGDVVGTTLEFDVGTYLLSLDGSFDGSNDGYLTNLFLDIHWYLLMVKLLALYLCK